MFKRIKNCINTMGFVRNTVRNIKNNPANLFVSTEALNGTSKYGYPIIHNSELLIGNGGIIAAVIPFQTVNLFGTGCGEVKKAIVVDDLFYKLNKSAQDFIIYHEIGHIVHEHTNPCKSTLEYNLKRMLTNEFAKMEMEADNYAASIVGSKAGYKALRQSLNLVKMRDSKEDRTRLRNMKQRAKAC